MEPKSDCSLIQRSQRLGRVQCQRAVLFRQLFAIHTEHQRRVQVQRRCHSQTLLQRNLPHRIVGQVFAANDVSDALGRIVHHHGELVGGIAVSAL